MYIMGGEIMESPTIGYCRVSTNDQNTTAQIEMLKNAGCSEIFQEKVSGKDMERPELKKMLAYIRKGDTVKVTKIDRLARSTRDLLNISDEIQKKGANLEILNINLDSSTPTGQLMLTMLAAIAQFERELMLERQREGVAIAQREGKYKGRKPIDSAKVEKVKSLVESGLSISKAVRMVGIARQTYYNAVEGSVL
jgi:DNA invertase Pin-like site-specific DNA recombinase